MNRSKILSTALALAALCAAPLAQAQQSQSEAEGQQQQTPPKPKKTKHVKKAKKAPPQQQTQEQQNQERQPAIQAPQPPPEIEQPFGHPTHPTEVSPQQTLQNPANEKKREREDEKEAQEIGKTTTTAAETVIGAERGIQKSTEGGGRYDVLSLELNPLGLFVGGRVSVQAEWVPVTHHALVVSPHIVHTSGDVAVTPSSTESQTFTGVGGELGYRYYTGSRGMNGVFVGPSIIAGAYNASLLDGNQPFTDIGIAADVGAQWILADHLTLGAGVGVEYLHVSHDFHDLPTGPSTIASTGVKPRLLLSVGGAI
ncbi:MAG TPA: DUF3575 domain-containing protein [Labilithrix sp.]